VCYTVDATANKWERMRAQSRWQRASRRIGVGLCVRVCVCEVESGGKNL